MVADVVVVGGGGSGLAAAIEAASLGREVVLLEKNHELGGTTAKSIGSISASATPHQIRKGIKDSPREHFEDMPKFHDKLAERPDNQALRRILTENLPETFRWLMSMGVEFMGPMPEPPHRKMRMHNVLPNSQAYIYHLERSARRIGVAIHTDVRARRLLRDGERVVGVLCSTKAGGDREFLARGGVVLASGDYAGSPELKAKYISEALARIEAINPTSTGDGQVMAMELGARILNGDLSHYGIRFLPPSRRSLVQLLPPSRLLMRLANLFLEHLPAALIRPFIMSFLTTVLVPSPKLFREGSVLVNKCGELIEAEEKALALPDQPDQIAYIVLDGATAKKFSAWPHYISTAPGIAYAYMADYRRKRRDIFHEAQSLALLALKIGAPPATFEESIVRYRERLRRESRATGKSAPPPLETPPFYALGPVKAFVNFTDGGLAVNEDLQVLNSESQPIPGLFAAGSTGQGGVILDGHGHHLGWAFTSGRIAGRNAAFLVTSEDAAQAPA